MNHDFLSQQNEGKEISQSHFFLRARNRETEHVTEFKAHVEKYFCSSSQERGTNSYIAIGPHIYWVTIRDRAEIN